MTTTTRRRPAALVSGLLAALLLLAGVAIGVRFAYDKVKDALTSDQCTFGAHYQISPSQASVASRMVGVVITRGLPEQAAVLVLAAALQESKLRNIPAGQGDRDSVGVLQQRPSQGWGSIEQLSDVRYATGAFLDALVKVPNWQSDPASAVIQEVQVSADGSAYAQHEGEARALADTLTGVVPAGIGCSFRAPSSVASPQAVADALATDLPVWPPTVGAGSVTVPGAGWATAAWFVANADRFGIERVSYGGRSWSRTDGWTSADASSAAVTATLHS